MKFFQSLKFKLILTLLYISLIPLLILAIFQLTPYRAGIINCIKAQEIEIANSNAQMIDSWINGKIMQLTELYSLHPEYNEMDKEEVMSFLKYIKSESGDFIFYIPKVT